MSKEGATVVDRWFVGCSASHVVCEGNSIHRYIGHSNNIVTVSASALYYGNRVVHHHHNGFDSDIVFVYPSFHIMSSRAICITLIRIINALLCWN